MYAADFVGEADSTAEYRCGVLQFVAEHTGEPFEAVAETYRKSQNLFRPAPRPNAAGGRPSLAAMAAAPATACGSGAQRGVARPGQAEQTR